MNHCIVVISDSEIVSIYHLGHLCLLIEVRVGKVQYFKKISGFLYFMLTDFSMHVWHVGIFFYDPKPLSDLTE